MPVPRLDPAMPRREGLRQLADAFAAAGLREPEADARILLEEACGLDRATLLREGATALGEAASELQIYAARRLAREPVFRILGRREFWGLDLAIGPAVLDPRPDTETVVLAALAAIGASRASRRILDLGTGSGALLCALLSELPDALGLGIDHSPEACAVALINLDRCGLATRGAVREGDWGAGLAERFDLVVSNPPYIERSLIPDLDPEVRDHDPLLALDGGRDGFDAYRAIVPSLPGLLAPGGVAVLEVGAGQAASVAAMVRAAGLADVASRRDLGGHERAVIGRWPGP